MVRVAKITDPKRIAELKEKINDNVYLEAAINRIASSLTDGIIRYVEVKSAPK